LSINRLYHSWSERIQQLFTGLRITQHRNMVWLLVGVYRTLLPTSSPPAFSTRLTIFVIRRILITDRTFGL
jgi:hypothetical protein